MARDLAAPPPDITPERLFALLVQPSPAAPLKSRISGAEDVPLFVRPVHATELAVASFVADEAPPQARWQRYMRELLARVVWTADGKAFGSAAEVGELDHGEIVALAAEAREALAMVGPTYARSDWQAWQAVLERGARHPLNTSSSTSLASCAEYGHGAVIYRPDRFWGRPTIELLDGHWFVYRASRAAWVQEATASPRTVAEALQEAKAKRAAAVPP